MDSQINSFLKALPFGPDKDQLELLRILKILYMCVYTYVCVCVCECVATQVPCTREEASIPVYPHPCLLSLS